MKLQIHLFWSVLIVCSSLLLSVGNVLANIHTETPKAFGSNWFRLEVDGQPVVVQKYKDIHYVKYPYSGNRLSQI